MSVVNDWIINLSPSVYWTLGIILLVGLTEAWFVYLCKSEKRQSGLLSFTISNKLLAGMLGSLTMLIITWLLMIVDLIITYARQLLFVFGIVGIVVVYIGINYIIASILSEERKNENKFKKGDKLRTSNEYDEQCESFLGGKELCDYYTYEFIKNESHGMIKIKSIDERSEWYGKTAVFDERFFKKK